MSRERITRLGMAIIAGASIFACSSSVWAEDLTFEEAIGQAKTAYDAEDYDKAVELLLTANRIQPNSRLLLNIARSYARGGDCANAVAYFKAFSRSDDAEDSLVKTANKEADELACDAFDDEASGRVMFSSVPTGASVSLDGKELGKTPFETVLLGQGEQKFVFTLEGYETFERTVKLSPQSDATVAASMQEKVEEVPEPVVVQEPVRIPSTGPDYTYHYVAGGIAGVGVGLVVLGLVSDLVLIPGTDEEREAFAPGTSDYQRLTDQRSSQATMALVGYIGGAALIAGGGGWLTYLLLQDQDEESLSVTPVFGADHAGLSITGEF